MTKIYGVTIIEPEDLRKANPEHLKRSLDKLSTLQKGVHTLAKRLTIDGFPCNAKQAAILLNQLFDYAHEASSIHSSISHYFKQVEKNNKANAD